MEPPGAEVTVRDDLWLPRVPLFISLSSPLPPPSCPLPWCLLTPVNPFLTALQPLDFYIFPLLHLFPCFSLPSLRHIPECDEDSQGQQQSSEGEGVAHCIHDPQLTQYEAILLLQSQQEKVSNHHALHPPTHPHTHRRTNVHTPCHFRSCQVGLSSQTQSQHHPTMCHSKRPQTWRRLLHMSELTNAPQPPPPTAPDPLCCMHTPQRGRPHTRWCSFVPIRRLHCRLCKPDRAELLTQKHTSWDFILGG